MLLCIQTGSLALTNEFVDYSWPTLLFNVNCTGQESSIWQCISDISDNRCSDGEDTSVICQSKSLNDETEMLLIKSSLFRPECAVF